MIWTRDRYLAHCQYEFTGREMFCELFGPLGALEDEWRAQGATEKEIGMTAFDWDYVLYTHLGGNCSAVTDREPVVIEDTPEQLIRVDADEDVKISYTLRGEERSLTAKLGKKR